MFCENCGKELMPGDKFCTNCGNKVPDYSQAVEPVVAQRQETEFVSQPAPNAVPAPKPVASSKKTPIALIVLLVVLAIAIIIGAVFGLRALFKMLGIGEKKDYGIDNLDVLEEQLAENSTENHSGNIDIPDGEFHPEYYEDYEKYDFIVSSQRGMGGEDFVFFEGSKFVSYSLEDSTDVYSPSYIANPISDKKFDYIQTYNNENNAIVCDGKCYVLNRFSEEFKELGDDIICPTAISEYNVIYVKPTSEDGTVGTLILEDCLRNKVTELATDVVASSTGVVIDEGCGELYHFYYQKNVDGKLALIDATAPEDAIRTGKDFEIQENIMCQGDIIPLGKDRYEKSLYYYDNETQTVYYVKKDEAKPIYQGTFDQYYNFDSGELLIISGKNVYYFAPSYVEEASLILDTGFKSITNKGCLSKQGFGKGYYVHESAEAVVVNDKKGKQYFLCTQGSSVAAVELTHKTTEPGTNYFDNNTLLYIENGVLLMDIIDINSVETYVIYDENRTVDYCVSPDGRDLFVYTGDASLYYFNRDKSQFKLIDTDVEYDKEYGANIACDYYVNYIIYGKDGQMHCYYPLEDEKEVDILDLPHGRFAREGIFNYFYADDLKEKTLVFNRHMCRFY